MTVVPCCIVCTVHGCMNVYVIVLSAADSRVAVSSAERLLHTSVVARCYVSDSCYFVTHFNKPGLVVDPLTRQLLQ